MVELRHKSATNDRDANVLAAELSGQLSPVHLKSALHGVVPTFSIDVRWTVDI